MPRCVRSCREALRHGRGIVLAGLIALAALAAAPLRSAENLAPVKLAFLYNFALYAEWPVAPESFEFCLIDAAGANGLRHAAEGLSRRSIAGRPIRVRFADLDDQLSTCHLALLPSANRQRVAVALERLKSQPVLTVVDGDDEVGEAAIIRLMLRDERLVFEANLTAARAAGLSLSAKLLRLARVVR